MKNNLKLLTVLTVTLSVLSCEKEEVNSIQEQSINPKDEVVQIILDQGFELQDIELTKDNNYLVEGDILFSSNIKDHLSEKETAKQGRVPYLMYQSNVRNIRVFIDNSVSRSGSDNWSGAIRQAMSILSNVSNSNVYMYQVYNRDYADIVVRSDYGSLGNNTIAYAWFPNNGRAGNLIRINLDYSNNRSMTYNQKLHNMVHEFGHTLGFRHTNWRSRGENNVVHVQGTPDYDSWSVMNAGTANRNYTGLSYYDKVMISSLY